LIDPTKKFKNYSYFEKPGCKLRYNLESPKTTPFEEGFGPQPYVKTLDLKPLRP
jgi:hypothetical protein